MQPILEGLGGAVSHLPSLAGFLLFHLPPPQMTPCAQRRAQRILPQVLGKIRCHVKHLRAHSRNTHLQYTLLILITGSPLLEAAVIMAFAQ